MAPSSHITVAQLLKLAETDVRITIPEADTTTILSTPPFLTVSGTFNMRDIGRVSGSPMRPNYAFRSGLLENLETNDFTTLAQKYGIKWIFDLRLEEEQTRSPDPDIIGIKNVWLPTTPDDSVDVSNFITGGGEEGYRKMYMDVMETHSRVFKALLKHVRDRAEEPFLIHCTLGRDRTGIAAALLMSIAGARTETVILDYMLSRIGLEPLREQLLHHAFHQTGCQDFETPGFHNVCSLRVTSWNAFLQEVQKVYGGFEGYAIAKLGFSKKDVEQIKSNLQR